jgi:hypothetical protein
MAEEAPAQGGTIIWLSNLTAGAQYDSAVAYLTELCNQLGYKFSVVYGDGFNDAAGNLQAVKNGMKKDEALKICAQAVLGSAKMILEDKENNPWALINSVCSPGGTTIEGVAKLQSEGFDTAVMDAVKASLDKDKKL